MFDVLAVYNCTRMGIPGLKYCKTGAIRND